MSDNAPANVTYTLTDEVTGETQTFKRIMRARYEGEERATIAGLVAEGWRQERAACWVLLPDRRFTITVAAGR